MISKLIHPISNNPHNMKLTIKSLSDVLNFLSTFYQLLNAPFLNMSMMRLHIIRCHLRKNFKVNSIDENIYICTNLEMEKNT